MRDKLMGVFVVSFSFFAFASGTSGQENCMHPRLISVTGTAEVNVAPNEAILTFNIETRGKDLTAAKSEHDSRFKKVMTLTNQSGIEQKRISTSNLTIEPDYSEEKIPKFLGYEVSQTIQITLKDVSKYEVLMTGLLQTGVDRVTSARFLVAEPRKYKDEARAKAMQAAREKAVAMAAELSQTVRKPWVISEYEDYGSSFLPMANGIVNSSFGRDKSIPQESTIAPGQVTMSASVRVSFLLE
jgi:hypothetical protein